MVPAGSVPPPPVNTTVGSLVYPVPPADTAILAIVVVVNTGVAIAPVQFPPVNTTVGVL